jgi:Flp pilus assembly protein TadD
LENLDSAKFYVNRGLEKYPSNKDLLIEKANFFIKEEDFEGAIAVLEDAISADPNNAILHNVYGTILLQLSRFEDAETPLMKAVEIDSTMSDAWYSLGTIQVERANAYVEKLNAKGLSNSEYEKLKNEQKGFYEAALPYFEKALELNPEDLYTVTALKKVYYQLEMSEEMKKMMDLEKELTGE